MESTLLLNVVVAQGTSVFKLLTGKDKTLLIGGDSFLVLDFGFDVVDGVRWLNIERDGLACWRRQVTRDASQPIGSWTGQ
jgi:hypothetical protein